MTPRLSAALVALGLLLSPAALGQNWSTGSPVGQIPGTTTNDNACAGCVGEAIRGNILSGTATVTITIATPGVVTWTAHGFSTVAPQPVFFTTTGALPTGITSGTVYYTVPSSVATNTFQIATTVANALAGTAVNTSGTQSGTQTGTSGTALATSTSADVTGIPLTAGDWDVTAVVQFNYSSAPTITNIIAWTAAASVSPPIPPDESYTGMQSSALNGTQGGGTWSLQIGRKRYSLSTTTTVFLGAFTAFTGGAVRASGTIDARRVR